MLWENTVIQTQAIRVGAAALLATSSVLLAVSAAAQVASAREHFDHATVLYDFVTNNRGEKLRTFITRPKDASGKVPVLFIVGWLSCDTMESPDPKPDDGFGILLRRLIDLSGFATVRMDKPGIGESQGDCGKADFQSEITGWQAAFDSLAGEGVNCRGALRVVGDESGFPHAMRKLRRPTTIAVTFSRTQGPRSIASLAVEWPASDSHTRLFRDRECEYQENSRRVRPGSDSGTVARRRFRKIASPH
jgi:hypothetical protein